ncbi:sporulation protein YlmC with PRC-barrel domain [Mesorhizobium sp. J18]|nr:sporulation protein YlmC with PRC-barrel domain [Mesorhizobium sp. J18]
MIRNLLATTAIATLLATGAYAQTTPTSPAPSAAPAESAAPMVKHAKGHLASELIGKRVYNSTGDDAQNIGSVSDLVMDEQGAVQAIVVGVGGFLGIGQKEVALQYDLVQWAERDGEEWLIVETTADALKAQQEFDRAAYRPMPADAEVSETKPVTAEDLANAPVVPEEGEAADDSALAPADDQSTTGMAAAPTDDGAAPADDTASAPADSGAATDDTASATDDAASDTTAAAPADDGTAPADDTASADSASETDDMAASDTATDDPASDTAAAPADDTETDTTAAAPGDDTQTSGESASSADTQTTDDSMAAAPSDSGEGTDQTTTGAVDRSSLQEMPVEEIRSEELVGTAVYGANEESVGEIGDVLLSEDGKVDAILVDVGGFLGIGEKEVAIGMDSLNFMSDADGNLYLYTGLTKEQLEQQASYDESTYAENRDEMRMSAPEAQ